MINVDNKVRNIYYMLCYNFFGERLNEKDEAKLGDEAFENIYNLFSLLLCLLLKKQIKKGLYKEYIDMTDEISTVRGKINLNKSINNNSLAKGKIVCEFDEYSENCLLNQVIKTTMFNLIKSKKIGTKTKTELKKLMRYFITIDIIDIRLIEWDKIKYTRNNMSYKYIIDICRLILKGLIVSDKNGKNKFKEFLDDTRVSAIYENFIRAYYKRHYPELNASSKKIYLTDTPVKNIPIMKTDITLEFNNRMLIIDAKFYSKILHDNYVYDSCKTISNAHLNQIYVYVDSQDPNKIGNVYGMLLYAQTINEPSFSRGFKMIGHNMLIRTLDMNESWENIRERLNNIATNFKEDSFVID